MKYFQRWMLIVLSILPALGCDTQKVATQYVEESLYGTVITLRDGTKVRGELVYVYDFSKLIFGEERDEQIYAIFDPTKYSPDPRQDRSFTMISSNDFDPNSIQINPPNPNIQRYEDFVREMGFSIEILPFNGMWHVLEYNESYHRKEGGCGNFAWDILKTDQLGNYHCQSGNGCNHGYSVSDHYAWNQPVLMPITGFIKEFRDDFPDNPPYLEHPPGSSNYVLIELNGGYYLGLVHFRQGSITANGIKPGNRYEVGTEIGRVGNSGFSAVPHIHMTLFWKASVGPNGCRGLGWSVPTFFQKLYISDTNRNAELKKDVQPHKGQRVSNDRF